MKNATYYSLAAAFAEETGSSCIVGGHNSDDLRFFEDTSDEFFAQLQKDAQGRFGEAQGEEGQDLEAPQDAAEGRGDLARPQARRAAGD